MNKSIVIALLSVLLIGCSTKSVNVNKDGEIIREVERLEAENQILKHKSIELESIISEFEAIEIDETVPKLDKELLENQFYNEPYMTAEWTDYIGYCYYIGEKLPRIYPSLDAPRISDNTIWLPDENEFIVEIIRHTKHDWYLVRIPYCENYVFVTPDELVQIDVSEYPSIPELPININKVSIGDSFDKFESLLDVTTILTGEYTSGLVYELYTQKLKRGFDYEGSVSVDIYNRILGMHLTSDKYVLESGYTIGDNADEVLEYYAKLYPECVSKNYKSSDNFFMYDVGNNYFIGVGIDTESLTDESIIRVIVISEQY